MHEPGKCRSVTGSWHAQIVNHEHHEVLGTKQSDAHTHEGVTQALSS